MALSRRLSSKPHDLFISKLYAVQGVVSYKVLPGVGAHATLRAYNHQCLGHMAQPDHASQDSDWGAIYMQSTCDHVLGTVPYRWESANEATLVAVTFHSPLDILVIGGEFVFDASVTGAEKAAAIKGHLGIDADSRLMHVLGESNKVALVQETTQEWELVVPHPILRSEIKYSERRAAVFRRHPYRPVTELWCSDPLNMDDKSKWERWNEGFKPSGIPDLSISWFRR